jgi:hypothetical protein
MSSNDDFSAILSHHLSSRNLHYYHETHVTASRLLSERQLPHSQFVELFPENERSFLDSFLTNDFGDYLHFMTLNTINDNVREVIGVVFWRELEDQEMEDWLCALGAAAGLIPSLTSTNDQRLSFQCQSDNALSQRGKQTMENIRSDSIRWLRDALNSDDNIYRQEHYTPGVHQLIHAWIQIELVDIKSTYSHHPSLSELLVLCLLSCVYSLHGETHVIHSIDPSSSDAIPKYTKFGFVHLSRYQPAGNNLLLLADLGEVLERCPWGEMRLA